MERVEDGMGWLWTGAGVEGLALWRVHSLQKSPKVAIAIETKSESGRYS